MKEKGRGQGHELIQKFIKMRVPEKICQGHVQSKNTIEIFH